jgi:hypothetical protein
VEKADSGLPKAVDQVLRSLREDGTVLLSTHIDMIESDDRC